MDMVDPLVSNSTSLTNSGLHLVVVVKISSAGPVGSNIHGIFVQKLVEG